MSAVTAVAPHRLLLTADELDLLRRLAGDLRLPVDFRVVARRAAGADRRPVGLPGRDATEPLDALWRRGLVRPDPSSSDGPDCPEGIAVHPSVLANLAVLAAPELLVETRLQADVDGVTRVIRAAHAVAGELGGSLVRLDAAAAVELSIFPATAVGTELCRIPPAVGSSPGAGAGRSAVPPVPAFLVDSLLAQACGMLLATVLVPLPAGELIEFGRVLWYATTSGWVGLASELGPDGQASARLCRVEPEDLGGWLAPLVGEAIR